MPPKPKGMDVDVVITQGSGGPMDLRFAMRPGGDRLQFKNDNHPGVMVFFNIDDRAGSGLLFQPAPADALWVARPGQPCPTSSSNWEGFVPLSVERDAHGRNTRLIAYFRNLKEEQCRFALRFLKADGTTVDYDPIGDGLNGPRS